jgi:cell division protein FtsB
MTQRAPITSIDSTRLPPRRRERTWPRRIARVLLFAACVVALDALVGERSLLQTLRAGRERERATIELIELRRRNAELRRDIERLQHDATAIEQAARGELGLIRRGEILVVLTNTPQR